MYRGAGPLPTIQRGRGHFPPYREGGATSHHTERVGPLPTIQRGRGHFPPYREGGATSHHTERAGPLPTIQRGRDHFPPSLLKDTSDDQPLKAPLVWFLRLVLKNLVEDATLGERLRGVHYHMYQLASVPEDRVGVEYGN